MCYMTTTTIVYTAPSSILPSIVSFSIPNAPIMSSVTMFLSAPSASLRAFKDSHSSSLLPPLRSSLLCRLVVALMPPPLILSTLPPPLPLNAQPWPIEASLPLVRWRLSSRLPLVLQLVVASPVVACLRLASPFVTQLPYASILNRSVLQEQDEATRARRYRFGKQSERKKFTFYLELEKIQVDGGRNYYPTNFN